MTYVLYNTKLSLFTVNLYVCMLISQGADELSAGERA